MKKKSSGQKKSAPKKKGSPPASIKKPAPERTAVTKRKKTGSRIQKIPHQDRQLKVVGVGGSAGGMEAFSSLLTNLPANLGMAYVYIQHLSPHHESFLPQILQRKTRMPVLQARDNISLEPDHVYVIPASYDITVAGTKLKLQSQVKEHAQYTIDKFFTSLATEYQQQAVGIILSGTGTDGTLGLMAIKAEGGISFAQDDSADYSSMPDHAAAMGLVDFVLPPDRIAKELVALSLRPYSVTAVNDFLVENKNELRKIHLLMYNKRGVDFSYYKQNTIYRRILRRMALNRIKDVKDYIDFLQNNKAETDALYQDLLITVTDFFRDTAMFQALTQKILPALFKNRRSGDPIRIWIPGCATGEEAISFAIVLLEYLGEKAISTQIQIFATDLNEKSIEHARAGIYLKNAFQNVSAQRLRKYFVKTDGHYQVIKTIRDMCIFAPHNLLKDPPFSRMDIISCQNVLIYIESAVQNKIMHAFHYALKSTGFLLLGKSETIGTATDIFEQSGKQFKVYTKRKVTTPLQMDFSTRSFAPAIELLEAGQGKAPDIIKEPDLEKETDKLLLTRYVPASVLINKDLEILRFRGTTSRYIEPTSGKASLNLLKMIKEELAFDLRTVIHRAKNEGRIARKDGIIINVDGGTLELNIEVIPLKGKGRDLFYLIVFKETGVIIPAADKTTSPTNSRHIEKQVSRLEGQLKEARDSIRIMTEDFEGTREELQAANEEILSSNEELQSINEELETSKEELQSANEELTTINEELQIRNTELKEASEYASAIGATMHESLVMLTSDLRIRMANKGFYRTFEITPDEADGQYLLEVSNGQWNVPELRNQLKVVQAKDLQLFTFELKLEFPVLGIKDLLFNVHKFPIKEGTGFRILLAIRDLTETRSLEETLKAGEERFRLLIQNASDIISVIDKDGVIKYESPAAETMLGYTPVERVGKSLYNDALIHADDKTIIHDLFTRAIQNPKINISGEFRIRHIDGKYRTIDGIFRNLLDDKKINGIIANYRDVTEKRILEQQKDEFIGVASHELKTPVTSIKAYAQILEQSFLKANDPKSAGLLAKMNMQVDRLTTLIVDLLDFTRLEGGKLKFRNEIFDLNDLVAEVVEEMQRTSTDHIITKKLSASRLLSGDRYRVGQVLTNLLSNAIKYSPGAKKITVTTKAEKENMVICVQDFGIGIDETISEKIFDRYFRVNTSNYNTISGLGLGLYIASEFVKRQGGNIWVKSTKGKGSTFCFSLPLPKKDEKKGA